MFKKGLTPFLKEKIMIDASSQTDLDSQLKRNKRVLALFYASWCPFCRNFLPSFKRIVAKRSFECVVLINMDDDDNPLWDNYSIEAVPSAILFDGGVVSRRLDSSLGDCIDDKQLLDWLREIEDYGKDKT
jgi:thiol-disulfide isomerase/thioredoxin